MKEGLPVLTGFLVAAVVSGSLAFLAAAHQPPSMAPYLPGALIGMVTAVVLSSLTGNRKVLFGSADQRDAALAMTPPPGRSLVYVYRKSLTGQALGLNLALDGTVVAQIRSGRFTCCPIAPGPHRLTASFVSSMAKKAKPAIVEIEAVAEGVYVYRIENVMGLAANTVRATRVVDLDEARRTFARMRLIVPDAGNLPGVDPG